MSIETTKSKSPSRGVDGPGMYDYALNKLELVDIAIDKTEPGVADALCALTGALLALTGATLDVAFDLHPDTEASWRRAGAIE